MRDREYPLYQEALEHESCGVGAVADLTGKATHRTVDQALTIVERLAHRAGSDALGTTGDGVGILTQLHHMRMPRRGEKDKSIVERAKKTLMRKQGLSEAEAHRAIQKYAMDHGMKMAEYAERILEG